MLELGRPKDALVGLRRAKQLGPGKPDVAFRIVRAELEAGNPEAATREAAEAARAFGADPEWEAAVGQLFLDKWRPEVALPYLRKALDLSPSRTDLRRHPAVAELKAHAPQEALATINNPDSADDYYLRAGAFYAMHRLVEADQACRQALAMDPREPRFILLRARIRQLVGQHDSALELLQRAVDLAPRWTEPYYSQAVS